MDDFWFWILVGALVANTYSLVRFIQALRRFTRSQDELDDLLDSTRELHDAIRERQA